MPPEPLTGRDYELATVGVVCLAAAGWYWLVDQSAAWEPVVLFAVLGLVSLSLAWWDVQSRTFSSSGED